MEKRLEQSVEGLIGATVGIRRAFVSTMWLVSFLMVM